MDLGSQIVTTNVGWQEEHVVRTFRAVKNFTGGEGFLENILFGKNVGSM